MVTNIYSKISLSFSEKTIAIIWVISLILTLFSISFIFPLIVGLLFDVNEYVIKVIRTEIRKL